MPVFFEIAAGDDLPALLTVRAGDVLKVFACGVMDRGDSGIVSCLGPFTQGSLTKRGAFTPAGRPNVVIIAARVLGRTSITLLIGPEPSISKNVSLELIIV